MFVEHKTSKAGAKASLPVVAPLGGTSGLPWAQAWLTRRKSSGLAASVSRTLLPAPAFGGGWSAAPMSTSEFGTALKAMLLDAGFAKDVVAEIGAHSCKATTLSWVAKAAIPRDDRRALGYHLAPGDRTMEAYSRDSMAGPLRCLVETLEKIRGGRFRPDQTRSGYLAAAPSPATSSTCPSALSSSAVSDEVDELNTEDVTAGDLVLEYVTNDKTGFTHHIVNNALACGKKLPILCTPCAEPPAGSRMCSRCF